jgi:uncharacterized protein (DUF1697 family)
LDLGVKRIESPRRSHADVKTFIALLRGINVGGSHMLPMKELKRLLEKLGCVEIHTYIQSGNVVFRSGRADAEGLATQLTQAVSSTYGFSPRVMVLTLRELARAVADNPFREAEESPKSLHLFFLAASPRTPDLKSLHALQAQTERFALRGRVLYLLTPEGFGRSKLAARVERLLGVEATARNWRTVTTLLDMAGVSR